MADKIKRISVNAMERVVKESGDNIVTKSWHGNELIIKRRIGLMEMMGFVDGVVKTCFNEEDGSYRPEVRDFAVRCSILDTYANFTLPENIENRYMFVYSCDAVDAVFEEIDQTQFELIQDAINERIAYAADANVVAANRQMNKLITSFEELESRISTVFEGVGEEDMAGIVKALQSGTLDEGKLVDAYFDARDKHGKHEFNGKLVEKESDNKEPEAE
jgi:hypothetical protein